jgi:uncharacterized repeat protein (TIGR01451 family)
MNRVWLLVALPVTVLGLAAAGSPAPPGSTDLKITKTANVDSVSVGSSLTYTISVENLGPATATGVTVADPLPKEVEYASATSTLGECSKQGQKAICTIGSLEAGPAAKVSSATVTVDVTARKSGTTTNTATVKGDQRDPASFNDRGSATVQILAAPSPATCRGFAATVVGTPGADHLTGTEGRDVIAALGGDDSVSSLSGSDLVCAGGGNDVVNAGAGADRVFGDGGRDRLLGRGGPDQLKGGGDGDVLRGNGGADRIRGGRGIDTCRGGAGRDSLKGCER